MMVDDLDNIIKYESIDGKISFEVNLKDETVWLTQKQMAELFDRGIPAVNEHVKNIFKERELEKKSTVRNFRMVRNEGVRTVERDIEHYNLDVIISVGYRVKSKRGTHFRQWATSILKDHIIKGYTTNTKRLIEKKLELEIRESVKMVEQVFLLKGVGKNQDSDHVIETVSTYLGKTLDQETMILKAHILTERFLIQYLKKNSKNSKIYDDERFTYKHILSISRSTHEPEEMLWLWELLNKLNSIRNSFAHTLENEELDKQVQEFIRITKLRLNKECVEIPNDTYDLKTVLVHFCGAVYSGLLGE